MRPLQVTQTTSINKKILLNTLGIVTGMLFIAGGITSLTLADWHVSFDLAVDIGFMSLGIGVPMMILCLVNVVTLFKSRPSSALNNIEQHLTSNNVIVTADNRWHI